MSEDTEMDWLEGMVGLADVLHLGQVVRQRSPRALLRREVLVGGGGEGRGPHRLILRLAVDNRQRGARGGGTRKGWIKTVSQGY